MTLALGAAALFAAPGGMRSAPPQPARPKATRPVTNTIKTGAVALSAPWQRAYEIAAGKTVEISVHLEKPSALPPNARIAVEWTLVSEPTQRVTEGDGRKFDAFGIYTKPTAQWRKTLHALDNSVYLVYRAPVTGTYTLRLSPVTEAEPVGDGPRWREKGSAPMLAALPHTTPWPAGTVAPVAVAVRPVALDAAEQDRLRTIVECEPNDTPEMAQPITLVPGSENEIRTWEVTATADDIEFFDNGKHGRSGDDWFRLDYKGAEPRLLTAQISMPGQLLASRIRAYKLNAPARTLENRNPLTAPLLPISEYFGRRNPNRVVFSEGRPTDVEEGREQNERTHQQDEDHRANITRMLYPGETYYLRVEANAPGYQLQLRLVRPAPYTDPTFAVRQAMYTHIGQVDAWLTNRPRGASLERRIRDTGNLLGTQCMSCHTQSGIWGPSVPIAQGYRVENVQNFWHLQNVMYECLRPTNELKDAANNTSLAPLDIGDGPAGTRAAGFNIVSLERIQKPRKLHSKQQIRTANYVLLTSDPGGINAAGPGSNIGFVVVNLFSTEILKTAWEKSGDPKYFRMMETKAKQVLEVKPQFTDDIALRIDYFCRVFPIAQYPEWVKRCTEQEAAQNRRISREPGSVEKFVAQVKAQLAQDEARLRAIQNEDGTWGFHPGSSPDNGKTWKKADNSFDPSPTALGLWALTSAGYDKKEPAIAKAVQALLRLQDPSGRWNRSAITGFVTTSYVLHGLSRLYPVKPVVVKREQFLPKPNESLPATIHRVQALALAAEPKFVDLLLQAANHDSPLVRYWAMIGLGATNPEAGVPMLIKALGDHARPVRDAATWAMRQTLLDDKGWEAVYHACTTGDDTTREQIMQVLNMRADAVMTQAKVNFPRLTALLDQSMNRDPHPAVRAWAAKAAWQWWVWNPPVRAALNTAWIKMLERPESNALTENALRYASQALFIVNGHKANGSGEHQYKELETLFAALTKRLDEGKDPQTRLRLAQRIVGAGGTFFEMAGGDGGPGQMGYVTPGSGEMMGKAALIFLERSVAQNNLALVRAGIEGGANVPYQPLNKFLVDYSLKGPEELRQLAASAVSDPRSVSLPAVPEQVEPQMAQVRRGAMEPPRRPQVSEPILNLWARVNWNVPKTEEQQRRFFDIMIPRFDHYISTPEIQAIADPAKRTEIAREMDAAWYLSDRLGMVLEQNPDLHQEIVFRRYFPTTFRNALEEHYWIRSVDWLLTFAPAMAQPESGVKAIGFRQEPPATVDATLTIKDRALQLYLDALKPDARPETRALAIRMANKTSLRSNPEVLRALAEALHFEKDAELRKIIENVLKQGTEKFLPDLLNTLKAEKHASIAFNTQGEPQPTKAQVEDILYFRDYVMPEMSRQKRSDQQSCVGCHGVEGRVPSFYLRPPDKFGYLPVNDLIFNYRVAQSKVKLTDLEKSKFLRKPLNIQDGQEDGHQGGRRYAPNDPGYLLLKKWVNNQPNVMAATRAVAP
jgi:hypothetical protein